MPKNIICIPRTNNTRELAIFYNSADVYINPTLEDNFPTTNLEALACGTPVITFNTGGSPESIEENCGYIVKVRDISNLKNAIRDLRKNKFSEDFCLSRSKKFDNNEMYNSYFNLFKSIVDGSKI
jgi:glycosyltransferase involved in cell wall biosynthesis